MNASPSSEGRAPARSPLRVAVEAAVPTVCVLTVLVLPLLVLDRLPDPVAAHWSGWPPVPNTSLPLWFDVTLLAVVTAAVGFGTLLAARGPVPRDLARVLVGVGAAASALLAGVRVAAVQANLDALSWQTAGPLPRTTLLVTLGAVALAGALGVWAAGDRPERTPELSPPADLDIEPGEAVVWSGVASSPAGVGISAVVLGLLALGTVLLPAEVRLPLLGTLLLLAVLAATLGQVRVTIGPAGLTARLGWIGLPRVHVPLAEVTAVRVEEVLPYAYGGYGYRFVPGVKAIVIRRGPGLRVERDSKRAIVVTVDHAAEAAGVLLAHQRAATVGTAS